MTAYYNEIDPYAAQWLRNLIAAGHIAPGVVDERSIVDVRPSDLFGFTQCHFFAGIGVWSYALRRAGWPDDRPVWTGSCPCQPFSAAGAGAGFDDERHLWPHWHHLVRVCRPPNVFGEQVASKDGLGWLDLVQADMEGEAYALWPVDLCAAGVGAPHIRQRLWFTGVDELADAASVDRRAELCDRGPAGLGRHLVAHGCGVGFLGDGNYAGLEGFRVGYSTEGGRLGSIRPVAASGEPSWLADQSGRGQRVGRGALGSGDVRYADGSGDAPRFLVNADQPVEGEGRLQRGGQLGGLGEDQGAGATLRGSVGAVEYAHGRSVPVPVGGAQGRDGQRPDRTDLAGSAGRPGPTNGPWGVADWLLCRDGKWRPVESGTFPLAHGATSRVGRLRAYGNAIVAEAAEAIIRIYLDHEQDAAAAARSGVLTMHQMEDLLG